MKPFTAGALANVGTDTTVDITAARVTSKVSGPSFEHSLKQSSGLAGASRRVDSGRTASGRAASGRVLGSVAKWQLQKWLHSTDAFVRIYVGFFATHFVNSVFAAGLMAVAPIRPAIKIHGKPRGFRADRPDLNNGLCAPFRSPALAVAARPMVGRRGSADGRSGF